MKQSSFSCYQCDEDDCNVSDEQLAFCKNAIRCWKSSLRDYDGTLRYARGCVAKLDHIRLVCSSKMQARNSRYRTECCAKKLCNGGVFPFLDAPENPTDTVESISTTKQILGLVALISFIGLIMIAIYCCQKADVPTKTPVEQERRRGHRVRPAPSNVTSSSNSNSSEMKNTPATDSTAKEQLECTIFTSTPGTSKPLPMQNNLSNQIALVESLSNGNFGLQEPKLWRGIWQGKSVMVKIYSSRSEAIWTHETEVYTKFLPSKHDNILRYIASDTTCLANDTQLWLITRYLTNGSLVNYLKEARLNQNGMLKACLSLTNGLLYLHTEINGTKSKLPMAHRNLSSKNVFVKNDGVCVIGNFEFVATQERLGEANFLARASKRYMSPELLEPTFEHGIWSLEGFQQADIYSMSLIFWEICRMSIKSKDDVSNYVAPFSELLTNDEREPTIEAMRKLILVDQRRPEIPEQWRVDPIMNALGSMIEECWNTKASARWPILRVKKTLLKLANN